MASYIFEKRNEALSSIIIGCGFLAGFIIALLIKVIIFPEYHSFMPFMIIVLFAGSFVIKKTNRLKITQYEVTLEDKHLTIKKLEDNSYNVIWQGKLSEIKAIGILSWKARVSLSIKDLNGKTIFNTITTALRGEQNMIDLKEFQKILKSALNISEKQKGRLNLFTYERWFDNNLTS